MDTLKERLDVVFTKQKEFQLKCGLELDNLELLDKLRLSEIYVYKAIEECIELRKTMPSMINRFEKTTPKLDNIEVLKELSDVILFLINFCLVNGFKEETVLTMVEQVQARNFQKFEEKFGEK